MTKTLHGRRLLYLVLAAVCAAALLSMVPSYAYFERGNVTVSEPETTMMKVGDTMTLKVSPAAEEHYRGCGDSDCPQKCGDMGCVVYVNGQAECTCKGHDLIMYYATVSVDSSDPSIATVEYDGKGNVMIKAVGPGDVSIHVCADFKEYQGVSRNYNLTVQESGTDDNGGNNSNNNKDNTDKSFPFTDVSADRWSRAAIQYAYDNGLFSGTSATTFAPETEMNRAMLVSVLYRLDGSPEVSGSAGFSDTASGAYYADAVKWAVDSGITSGTGDGKFDPDSTITREQFASMLYRYATYKGYDTSYSGNLSAYSDADSVSAYAAQPVAWAVSNGIMSGTSQVTLSPQSGATREQAAALLMRFAQKYTAQ